MAVFEVLDDDPEPFREGLLLRRKRFALVKRVKQPDQALGLATK